MPTLPKHRKIEPHDLEQMKDLFQMAVNERDGYTIAADVLFVILEKQNEIIERINDLDRVLD